VLRVAVRTPSGQVLYRSSAGTRGFVAWDTLEASYGQLALGITLRPEVADELVVGGLPRSQRPLLIGLVLLTSAMLIGAVVHLRRQQELVRLRANFISGVSHELRTPLTQIRLFAELLHTGDLRSDSDRARAARVVDQEARRLTYLVENVLAFSRHERHQERVVREPADVSAELREALELFTPVARARGVMLVLDAPEILDANVDTNALRQIVLNLLDNAVKYGPDDQTVTVHAEPVGETAIRVAVQDEGPGVPPEARERIWEPYERLPRDQASAVGGSGIGLAVVRDLARLHGGRSWVERGRERGAGSRFVVELATGDDHEMPGEAQGTAPPLAATHVERT
jgi:signal transduction histidine kinase